MATWNCRGSMMMAKPLSVVTTAHVPSDVRYSIACCTFAAAVTASMKPAGLSNRKNVAMVPTARNAASLTTDSTATARTSPSWCSVASACRVPNSEANTASSIATTSEMSLTNGSKLSGEPE